MAARMSKHGVDVFDSCYGENDIFRLENTARRKLKEQRYKVNLLKQDNAIVVVC